MSKSRNFGHSAEYKYLDDALREHWHIFLTLESEILSFQAKPIEAFNDYFESEVKQLQAAFPQVPLQVIRQRARSSTLSFADPIRQFTRQFAKRLNTEHITIIILSHALTEALLNGVIAICLQITESLELFPLFEQARLKDKLRVVPISFDPTYAFPKGTALDETFNMLMKQRNALLHPKLEIKVEGKVKSEGTQFMRSTVEKELQWIRRYFSLPYDLSEFLQNTVGKSLRYPIQLLRDRGPIEIVNVHRIKVMS